jgi:hypothetical protein
MFNEKFHTSTFAVLSNMHDNCICKSHSFEVSKTFIKKKGSLGRLRSLEDGDTF